MKSKGSRTERELFHLFWNKKIGTIRVAGSGSTSMPAPDLLVGLKNKVLAIECKSGKGTRYVTKDQIGELKQFAEAFGATPIVAVRFNNTEWRFLELKDLKESRTGNNFVLEKEHSRTFGKVFEDMIK
ncbi:MAG: Holliday junction resolvase Hjc [Candidatus Nanoarchaeia archaeon]|nr:Holliday junction resolvase Hjc [Candidatus Nanoarchaeia archaeon]